MYSFRMEKFSPKLRQYGVRITLAIVIFFAVFLSFRNSLLQYFLRRFEARMLVERGVEIHSGKVAFTKLFTVGIDSLLLKPVSGDTIVFAERLEISASLIGLLSGNIRLSSIYADQLRLNIVKQGDSLNLSGLLNRHRGDKSTKANDKEMDLSGSCYQILSTAFDATPDHADLEKIEVRLRHDSLSETMIIPFVHSNGNSFDGIMTTGKSGTIWNIEGSCSSRSKTMDVEVKNTQSDNQSFPLISSLFGIDLGFSSFHFLLANTNWHRHVLKLEGELIANDLSVYHKRISEDTVFIPKMNIHYSVIADRSSVSIDSSSIGSIGAIQVHPELSVTKGNSKSYSLKLATDAIPATEFFESLPQGMFAIVRSVKADGNLQYSLSFHYDSRFPDSVQFESELSRDRFRLLNAAESDLLRMNGEFRHEVYENDRLVRSFMVGPSNPDFTPLDRVSSYFKNSVLTSEDGNFFFHHGFNEEAFRGAILANIEAGKFVRGGSTISMQLIKNVYLSRKKTIARKAEEALLVWLIENNHLCTKERMFEVYLNIIELGPGVYGIGEASRFYFDKTPGELSLAESIYLASLLPHPKWFKYSFDKEGNLKPYLAGYYRVMSNFMLRKNLISQEEHDALLPKVELKGVSRQMILPADSIPPPELNLQ